MLLIRLLLLCASQFVMNVLCKIIISFCFDKFYKRAIFKVKNFYLFFFQSDKKNLYCNIQEEFFSFINNAVFCRSRRLQKCIFVEIFDGWEYSTIAFWNTHIHFAHYIHFTRRGLLFNTLKTLQAIVVKRYKLVYVNQRDALIITCKCNDVFHIQVRMLRIELVYASRNVI